MQFHRGRLIDHVHLRVKDVEASKRFYRAVFESLGLRGIVQDGEGWFQADELYVDKADGPVSRVHLAFQAADRDTVHAFHKAALGDRWARQRRTGRARVPSGLLRRIRFRPRRQQHRGRVPRPGATLGGIGGGDAQELNSARRGPRGASACAGAARRGASCT